MARSSARRQRLISAGGATLAGVALCTLFVALLAPAASAFRYPDTSEAVLLLDGTQGPPNDGFNMEIDTNGFATPGGTTIDTHMFCIMGGVPFRCGLGSNDLIRVQGQPSAAGIDSIEANQLAWILTHHASYTDEETQYAIWCITNPGLKGSVGNSDQLCHDGTANAVPAAPQLTLAALGASNVDEGQAVHFQLVTNAPDVNLAVDDSGALPTLCGTAPDNAHATINGATLVQNAPASLRTFELCLTRSNVVSGAVSANLVASLDATTDNLQVWVHPTGPSQCQGLIDTQLTGAHVSASAAATWNNRDGWLTVTKSTIGDIPPGATFDVHVTGAGVDLVHTFPDADGDPWTHTFADLPEGSYTVTETLNGGATEVDITPDGPILITRDAGSAVSVVNHFTGRLRLAKQTDVPRDRTFPFVIDCEYHGASVNAWSNPVTLAPGTSFLTPELPAGTVCSVLESDTGGAISTVIDFESGGVQGQSVSTQAGGLVISNGDVTTVAFTNIFSAQGSTSTSTTVAATSSTDDHTIDSQGSTVPVNDTTPDTGLAGTGSNLAGPTMIAGLALVGGLALAASARRRRVVARQQH